MPWKYSPVFSGMTVTSTNFNRGAGLPIPDAAVTSGTRLLPFRLVHAGAHGTGGVLALIAGHATRTEACNIPLRLRPRTLTQRPPLFSSWKSSFGTTWLNPDWRAELRGKGSRRHPQACLDDHAHHQDDPHWSGLRHSWCHPHHQHRPRHGRHYRHRRIASASGRFPQLFGRQTAYTKRQYRSPPSGGHGAAVSLSGNGGVSR